MFDAPLNPLKIRVVLAPVELGPYNRHYGYTYEASDAFHLILGNRHICELNRDGVMTLIGAKYGGKRVEPKMNVEDFIVHELTHHRQQWHLERMRCKQNRGVHRDPAWYAAISEAAPRYLGVEFPESVWPKVMSKREGKRVKKVEDTNRISEVEATHWPDSFRELISAGDPRLKPCRAKVPVLQMFFG